ncbi:MAG: hypothetical protein LBK43_00575 [Treponema sp.]|nr:hypothetical protein [Treponema sp.]
MGFCSLARSGYDRSIDFPGEADIYTFTVTNSGSYQFTLNQYNFDAYAHVYRNDSLLTTIDDQVTSGYYALYFGDTVMVVVTPYSLGSTGNYGIQIDQE